LQHFFTGTPTNSNRLDMLLTGIETPVGIKVFSPNLAVIRRIGPDVEGALRGLKGTRSVYAERVTQGYFTDIEIDRAAIARHGLSIANV
jgi:copper/silver efflux system protein